MIIYTIQIPQLSQPLPKIYINISTVIFRGVEYLPKIGEIPDTTCTCTCVWRSVCGYPR